MKFGRVKAVYYSAVGHTEKVVKAVAQAAADKLALPVEVLDFTLPAARQEKTEFAPTDLVVFGTPVYAGKVPNKMMPWVAEGFAGNGAFAVPVVTFGNRSFDNGLAELCSLLEKNGFHTVAGAAVVCEHVFSDKLACGRPNADDLAQLAAFGAKAAEKAAACTEPCAPIQVAGDAAAPYYTPLGTDGKPAVFLKAKPALDGEKCTKCGTCAAVCPVGSISAEAPGVVAGLCIKCQACIKKCPEKALYWDNGAFLSHIAMLEENYTRPAESSFFI